jgi:hypothetical protein
MTKRKTTYLVKVTFLDHCLTKSGVSPPIECVLYGLLIGQDKDAYYIASWIACGEIDENSDTHTILKSAVKKMKKISKQIL